VRVQAVVVRQPLQILVNLTLASEHVAPVGVGCKRERVDAAFDIAGRAGVGIITPYAADLGRPLGHGDLAAGAPQLDRGAQAAEAGADHGNAGLGCGWVVVAVVDGHDALQVGRTLVALSVRPARASKHGQRTRGQLTDLCACTSQPLVLADGERLHRDSIGDRFAGHAQPRCAAIPLIRHHPREQRSVRSFKDRRRGCVCRQSSFAARAGVGLRHRTTSSGGT
jgi:hypothetical protein